MRWSIEELIYGLRVASNNGYRFWPRLIKLPKAIWRMIIVFWHWGFTGYCWATIWDLDNYLIKVLIGRLKQFKKMKKCGYPGYGDVNSEEDWAKVIDRLIEGFEIMKSQSIGESGPQPKGDFFDEEVEFMDKKIMARVYKNLNTPEEDILFREAWDKQYKYDEETIQLFAKYFRSLWD